LLSTQANLEKEDLVLHNFKWQPKVVAPPKKAIQQPQPKTENPKPPTEEVLDFVALLKKETANFKKDKTEIKTEIAKEPEPIIESEPLSDPDAMVIHCHPATIRERKDPLYGDVRKTIQFGKKFTFEGIMLDCNGLAISLYTEDKNITLGSVIYPSKYKNGDKLEHYRWWKITNVAHSNNGFLIAGELTDDQKDFSD
jgi:hypothetical protein